MLGTRLQRKTLFVIGFTFIGLFLVLYAVSRAIVLGSFAEQEDIEAKQNVGRVVGALEENLRSLEGTARDWSLWDDTAKYAQDRNRTYFDANLVNISTMMTNNHLNLVMFLDKNDNVIFEQAFDYNTGQVLPVPKDLRGHVAPGTPLLKHKDADSSIKGVIMLAQAPMLLASEPIMRGNGTGPVVGTIVFGRYLDQEAIQHLSQVTLLGVTVNSAAEMLNEGAYKELLPTIGTDMGVELIRLSDSTIEGLQLYPDVFGDTNLIIDVKMNRAIYQRGEQAFNYYILSLLGVGMVFAIVIMGLLSKLVLYRLARLRSDVKIISASTDMAGRVKSMGNDEISDVADSINEMLVALERARAEQREGEERYRAVVEQSSEAIFLADVSTGRFIEVNAAAQVLLGHGREDILRMGLGDIVERSVPVTGVLTMGATGKLRLSNEQKYKRRNGTTVNVEVSEIQIRYGGKDVLCVVARDITERKRADELLHELAMRDGLTGLYNRREMHRILKERVERFSRYAEGTSVVLMDIDYFKSVNDTYGHQVGDEVIRWIAAVTQDLVRLGDKVARYGGEELAIILPETELETALQVSERIRQAIEQSPFEYRQRHDDHIEVVVIPLTVSMGVATLPNDGIIEETIIKAADKALYAAKHGGRNRSVAFAMAETVTEPALSSV